MKEKVAANKFVVAYFGEESDDAHKVHLEYADMAEKFTFVHTSDSDCATEHGAKTPGFVFFRKFDTMTNVYEGEL